MGLVRWWIWNESLGILKSFYSSLGKQSLSLSQLSLVLRLIKGQYIYSATWRGSSNEPFELVANFQRRFPHQSKVVFVSIDDTQAAYDLNTKQKNWLSMEYVHLSLLLLLSPDLPSLRH